MRQRAQYYISSVRISGCSYGLIAMVTCTEAYRPIATATADQFRHDVSSKYQTYQVIDQFLIPGVNVTRVTVVFNVYVQRRRNKSKPFCSEETGSLPRCYINYPDFAVYQTHVIQFLLLKTFVQFNFLVWMQSTGLVIIENRHWPVSIWKLTNYEI